MQTALSAGMVLEHCTAVTLHGPATLTWALDQYPFAQGTILDVTNSYLTFTIKVCGASSCPAVYTARKTSLDGEHNRYMKLEATFFH